MVTRKVRCVVEFDMVNATKNGKHYSLPFSTSVAPQTDLLFAQEAVRVVSNHPTNQSLFLYMAWGSPHAPDQSPASYQALTNVSAASNAPLAHLCGVQKRRAVLGMVAVLDRAHSLLISALQQRGLWNDTIFVFLSDNGGDQPVRSLPPRQMCANDQFTFNYPLRGGKYSWWEGGIRTVSFIYAPKYFSTQGNVFSNLISIADWRPTLLSAAGLQDTADLPDAVNQWDNLVGVTETPARNGIVHQVWVELGRFAAVKMINGKLWKFIRGWPAIGNFLGANGPTAGMSTKGWLEQPPELLSQNANLSIISTKEAPNCEPMCLFQVTDDPSELSNLAGRAEYQPIANELNAFVSNVTSRYKTTLASNVCQSQAWDPQRILVVTDGLAFSTAAHVGGYVPWLPGSDGIKIPTVAA